MDLDIGRISCLQPSLKRYYQYISIVAPAQAMLSEQSSMSRILRNVGLYTKVSMDAGFVFRIFISTFKPIVSSRRSLSLQKSLLSSGLIHCRRQPCLSPSFLR